MPLKSRPGAFRLAVGSLLAATAVSLVGNSLSITGLRGHGLRQAAAAEPDFRPSAAGPAQADLEEEGDSDGQTVRLTFFNASWAHVLRKVAKDTGAELVMDKFPADYYSRFDRTKYTRTEAVRILNRELEPKGFRLLEQGNHLVLLQLDSLVTRYPRPLLPNDGEPSKPAPAAPDERGASEQHAAPEQSAAGSERPAAAEVAGDAAPRTVGSERAAAMSNHPAAGDAQRIQRTSATEGANEVVVDARRSGSKEVARVIYTGLRERAELITAGPGNLPAFRVYRSAAAESDTNQDGIFAELAPGRGELQFAIGIDTDRNELVVAADAGTQPAVEQLIRTIDAAGATPGQTVRLISGEGDMSEVTRRLETVLERMAAQRIVSNAQVAQLEPPPQLPQQLPPQQQAPQQGPRAGQQDEEMEIPGLRGSVRLRYVPNVGWIVIAGDPRDIAVVQKIINELNRLVAGTLAQPHLRELQFVNSEAMAVLLNDVYAELMALRGGRVQASIIPVVKPNAILVLANSGDLRIIDRLIGDLDRPVDPQTEFEVFRLKHATAATVATTLTGLYPEQDPAPGAGLRVRVRAIPDARTNSIIVQASPRDLAEVALVIERIDRDASDAVSRMRIFTLKNATAVELAPLITEAVQSVLTAGPGAADGGAASRIIEFLSADGDPQNLVRSGILSDIRVTADARANTLIVTAPEQSMMLMGELIRHLDSPSPAVAQIKVFTLANADATAMLQLLTTLFAPPPGQAGIGVGEGEDAVSRLIPVRFSADVRSNSVIAVGSEETLRVVEAVLLRLDETEDRDRRDVVLKLRNSPAADVAAAITTFIATKLQIAALDPQLITQALLERQVVVVPEIVSNSLLISVSSVHYDEVMRLVSDLDKAPPQVVIQVLIVEVDLQNTDEFGIELGFQDSILFDRGLLSNVQTISTTTTAPNGVQTTTQEIISAERAPGFNFNNPAVPLGNNAGARPSRVGSQGLSNFSLGRINGDLGFGGLVLSAQSESISALLRALAAHRRVNILSRPQIRTVDNQLAYIQVGQQVPVVSGVTTNALTGALQPVIGAPQQVGIILQVTPRITPEGMIIMETIANKSAISGQGVPIATDGTTGGVIESPIFDLTEARAVIAVPDGQTVVLGGMITKNDNVLERKVPWVGDIPFVGRAFRYDSTVSRRTELLIFLTPRVIRNSADSEFIKVVESEKLHFLMEDAEAIHGPLFAVPPDPMDEFCPPPGSFLPGQSEFLPPVDTHDVPTTIMPSTPTPFVPLQPTPGAGGQTPGTISPQPMPAPGESALDDVPPPAPPVFPQGRLNPAGGNEAPPSAAVGVSSNATPRQSSSGPRWLARKQ